MNSDTISFRMSKDPTWPVRTSCQCLRRIAGSCCQPLQVFWRVDVVDRARICDLDWAGPLWMIEKCARACVASQLPDVTVVLGRQDRRRATIVTPARYAGGGRSEAPGVVQPADILGRDSILIALQD